MLFTLYPVPDRLTQSHTRLSPGYVGVPPSRADRLLSLVVTSEPATPFVAHDREGPR